MQGEAVWGDFSCYLCDKYQRFDVTSFSYCCTQAIYSSPTGTLFFMLK